MRTLRGVIHGRAIQLQEEPGYPDGQEVTVTVEPSAQSQVTATETLDALKRAAGSWSDDTEGLDRYLEWNRQKRKVHRREIPE